MDKPTSKITSLLAHLYFRSGSESTACNISPKSTLREGRNIYQGLCGLYKMVTFQKQYKKNPENAMLTYIDWAHCVDSRSIFHPLA